MPKWPLTTRIDAFKTLIFSELAEHKRNTLQKGTSLIDLSIGSPDLGPPAFIRDVLATTALDPLNYGYTLAGSQDFNLAVRDYYKKFGVEVNPVTEVLQLTGSQDGLVHLPMIYAEEGDIILVPDPGYTAYDAGVKLSGADLYPMPLKEENAFLPDLNAIPTEVAQKAKMMILNFPGNPVPALATEAYFQEVIAFAKKHQIIVIHDFAYCELVFDGQRPVSFMSIDGAKDVGVEFNSLSKSFNMAGARVGYVVGNPEIISALNRLKSNLDYGIFAPIEKAAIQALTNGRAFTEENRARYESRRNVFIESLHQEGWNVKTPPASMFVWARLPEGWSSEDFAYRLIDKAGVVVTPGNAFGAHGEGYVRIALVQPEPILKEAAHRIGIFLNS